MREKHLDQLVLLVNTVSPVRSLDLDSLNIRLIIYPESFYFLINFMPTSH